MSEGTIKRKTDRGFGFMRASRGHDRFFHMSTVDGATVELLRVGQRVSFVETKGDEGARAENGRPL